MLNSTGLYAAQTFDQLKTVSNSWNAKFDKEDPGLLSSWNLISVEPYVWNNTSLPKLSSIANPFISLFQVHFQWNHLYCVELTIFKKPLLKCEFKGQQEKLNCIDVCEIKTLILLSYLGKAFSIEFSIWSQLLVSGLP